MARLFIAVWPPEHVVEALCALPRKDQRGVRFVDPDRWHITLRFLGECDAGSVDDAMAGFDEPSAEARLGPGIDVLAERALVVPAQGLDELAAEVIRRTAHLGQPPRKRFVGHLTLARLKPRAVLPKAMAMYVAEQFVAEEVALVQSQLHPDGARYTTIATWPLG